VAWLVAALAGALPLLLVLATNWLGHSLSYSLASVVLVPGVDKGAVTIGVAIITAGLLIGYFLVGGSSDLTRQQLQRREAQLREDADEYHRAAAEARAILEERGTQEFPRTERQGVHGAT